MKNSRFAAAFLALAASAIESPAQWSIGATAPDSTGLRSVVATLYASGERNDTTQPERLLVRCHQNRLDVFVFLGWRIAVDDSGMTRVSVAWNDGPAEVQSWVPATNGEAIFFIDAAPMVERRLLGAGRLTLDVPQGGQNYVAQQSAARRVTFEPAGFAAHLQTFKDECPDDPWIGTSARAELDDSTARPYFEFQVDKQVALRGGSLPPRYPDELRRRNVEGEVLVQFVVRPNGWVDRNTIKVLKSTHPLFTAAVRESLLGMRFVPAEIAGKKVSQLVQQPFNFALMR